MTNSPNSTASGIGHALASWLTHGGSGALERMQPKEEAPATGGLAGLPVPLGGTCDGEGKPITRLAYTRCAFPATEVQISLSAILSPPSRRGYPILWQLRFARRRFRGNL